MDLGFDGVRGVLYPMLRLGVRWRISGVENIPESGAVILACNHTSYLDPLALGYIATKRGRRTRFLTKDELFAKPVLGGLLRRAGMIPVNRGTADAAGSLVAAEQSLGRGRCVAVFPEGTISPDLDPMAGKTGTARLAAATGAVVVPIGLWGLHRVMFKGRKPRWRAGVVEVAMIGEPFRLEPDEDAREGTDRIMTAICEQVARARSAYPQTPKPKEGEWWVRTPESAVLRRCG